LQDTFSKKIKKKLFIYNYNYIVNSLEKCF